jgi:hypothetical protein
MFVVWKRWKFVGTGLNYECNTCNLTRSERFNFAAIKVKVGRVAQSV